MKDENLIHFPVKAKSHKGKRFYAFGIDLFIVGLLTKMMMITYAGFFRSYTGMLSISTQEHILGNLDKIYIPILAMVFWGYFLTSYYVGQGRTLGKLLFKIRVLSHEGNSYHLSFQEAFMRTMGYFLCYATLYIPFTINFLRKDGKGLADWFSQTEVVSEDEFQNYLHYFSQKSEENDHLAQMDLFDQNKAA